MNAADYMAGIKSEGVCSFQAWSLMLKYRINFQGDHGVSQPQPGTESEYDCLMTTPAGRFIAIDFKSAGKDNKYRAQQSSVRIAGGPYADLYYLYP